MGEITIKKIAADLNLAVSTVSKALRDSHEISPETKSRVFEYATRLDYAPNPYASSLKRRRSGNIAVVLPEVSDSFFSSAIDGIEEVAQKKGYHVMVYLTHEDIQREQSILRDFRSGRVDGVLLSVAACDNQHRHLVDWDYARTPVVFFDRVYESVNAASVTTNDFDSGYLAARHLIEKGCKRIAFLALFENLGIIRKRLEGYRKAILDSGLVPENNPVISCSNNELENRIRIAQLLKSDHRPDSIIGSVEKVAIQTYTVCHELKLSIPEDIKVIGFSHLQIADLLKPSLTTITQPAFDMGKAAATLLFKALERKRTDASERMVIPSVLIERDSTRQV